MESSNPITDRTADQTAKTTPAAKQGLWDRIRRLGLEPAALRTITVIATVVMMTIVVLTMSKYYVSVEGQGAAELKAAVATQAESSDMAVYISQSAASAAQSEGIRRELNPDTVLPMRARTEIITYTVQVGDNLFSIAERFNLLP